MERFPDELVLSFNFLKKLKPCAEITDDRLLEMCRKAIDIDASHAEHYQGWDIYKALAEYKVKAEQMDGGVYGNRLVRAQYDDSVKTVVLYTTGIESMVNCGACDALGVENTMEKMREILLWHEFFHVLEFKHIGLIGKQFPLPKKFLWFTVQSPLYSISEICANAFAMRVMGLAHNPFIVDYLLHTPTDEEGRKE